MVNELYMFMSVLAILTVYIYLFIHNKIKNKWFPFLLSEL